jgi:fructan beta-fructosidase
MHQKQAGIMEPLYQETYRPQFHFTAARGWLNDPNGLVFHAGEYHLFFQHNPLGTEWGNMTWGHAVSRDLLHWQQLSNAIEPYDEGTIWSGSAVVDIADTSGLASGGEPPLVAFFTHARRPFGQAMAHSVDRGRTFHLYRDGRHLVPNQGLSDDERDPQVLWHAPSRQWVMVLWVRQGAARFFVSDDLAHWEWASDFEAPGFYECPDLFELPVNGSQEDRKWVLHDAALRYWVGEFDGCTFHAEEGPLQVEYGPHFYAAQTWDGTPGRRVQIAWMRGGVYPDMPFNQQMSCPCELSLYRTPEGVRLLRYPVTEIERLRCDTLFEGGCVLVPGDSPASVVRGTLLDIGCSIRMEPAAEVALRVYDQEVRYDAHTGLLMCAGRQAPLPPAPDGTLSLRVLVDRTSLEVFGNGGAVSMAACFVPQAAQTSVTLAAEGGAAEVEWLSIYQLESIWASGGAG